MIHTHEKFAPLDFISKNMNGKRRFSYPNRTSPNFTAVQFSEKHVFQFFQIQHNHLIKILREKYSAERVIQNIFVLFFRQPSRTFRCLWLLSYELFDWSLYHNFRYTYLFIINSCIRNLYWDSQMTKTLSVLKPRRLRSRVTVC